MKIARIYYEMARRYKQFHAGKEWSPVTQLVACDRKTIQKLLDDEKVIQVGTAYSPCWIVPTEKMYQECIVPLMEKYSVNQLYEMGL